MKKFLVIFFLLILVAVVYTATTTPAVPAQPAVEPPPADPAGEDNWYAEGWPSPESVAAPRGLPVKLPWWPVSGLATLILILILIFTSQRRHFATT